jgi:hypothetical protein
MSVAKRAIALLKIACLLAFANFSMISFWNASGQLVYISNADHGTYSELGRVLGAWVALFTISILFISILFDQFKALLGGIQPAVAKGKDG